MEINRLLRPHLLDIMPYSSARDEFKGEAEVYLDANENAIGSTSEDRFRRYPDPYQSELKEGIAKLKGVDSSRIFLGNGSDEPIDLLIRAFCNPGKDKIIIAPPTYGMYEVSAGINDVGIVRVSLKPDFSLDTDQLLEAIVPGIKIIFLCSPNNPTGNSIDENDLLEIVLKFQGLVVLDEAYIDFAKKQSMVNELANYPNLVILQTFSKAWGLASLRIGMAFADPEIIRVLNMIKPPYNINGASQQFAIDALKKQSEMQSMVNELLIQRERLAAMLSNIQSIRKVYPSDANFILVKIDHAHEVYHQLIAKKVIVRDRSKVELCENCLRITVGTEQENEVLINQLHQICQ